MSLLHSQSKRLLVPDVTPVVLITTCRKQYYLNDKLIVLASRKVYRQALNFPLAKKCFFSMFAANNCRPCRTKRKKIIKNNLLKQIDKELNVNINCLKKIS